MILEVEKDDSCASDACNQLIDSILCYGRKLNKKGFLFYHLGSREWGKKKFWSNKKLSIIVFIFWKVKN